jgi:hypothetical protein
VVVVAPGGVIPPALGQRDPAAIGVLEPDMSAAELGSRVASRQPDDLVLPMHLVIQVSLAPDRVLEETSGVEVWRWHQTGTLSYLTSAS